MPKPRGSTVRVALAIPEEAAVVRAAGQRHAALAAKVGRRAIVRLPLVRKGSQGGVSSCKMAHNG